MYLKQQVQGGWNNYDYDYNILFLVFFSSEEIRFKKKKII